MPQNAASDQGLECLSLIWQFVDIPAGGKMALFKFEDKYGKVSQYLT